MTELDWFTRLQKWEIDLTISVQQKYSKHEELFGQFSTMFGTEFLYLFVIPLFAGLNTRLYHKTLIASIVTEFANLLLKWYFAADRPFWWVHETKVYSALNRPTLYQTERTCETSPGSPSGHMMIGAGFLFISLITVEKLIVRNFRSNGIRRILRYLARIAFAAFLIVLALSRMYFSTHFLHQCILGAVFGICITEAVVFTKLTDKIQLMQKSSWFKCALLMSAGVGASYWIVKAIYGNPMESVHLAFKYCSDPLYPKPEKTVVFSAIRNISMICGFMMAAPLGRKLDKKNIQPQARLKLHMSIPFTIILMIIQWQFVLYTPKMMKIFVFYTYTAVVYGVFQFLLLKLIPKYCAQTSKAVPVILNEQDKPKDE